ncbi:type 4 pilus major pilin [Flexibacterium corallicola]|uniref:type 4 pilus major pilin n=1 Tax=Flexibacterium corallicola TaxID=3037259 RepID=UPI00286F0DC4|nr:type 4 pilus major pilin [Pseudovibrio sp. M1P-2-3]
MTKYESQQNNWQAAITKRRNKGATLTEMLLVMGIIAGILVTVFVTYQLTEDSRKSTEAMQELASIQSKIRNLYSGQSNYNGIGNSSVIKMLPSTMVNGSSVLNAFQGVVTIAAADGGGGSNSGFSIKYDNIPMEGCIDLATSDLGPSVYTIKVNTTTKSLGSGDELPFNPGNASTACSSEVNSLTWIFR